MGYVTVHAFIEKEAFLASWPTCLAWYGLKAAESAMKAVRIETARCELPYASSSRPHRENSHEEAPLLLQPFEPVLKAGAAAGGRWREHAATVK